MSYLEFKRKEDREVLWALGKFLSLLLIPAAQLFSWSPTSMEGRGVPSVYVSGRVAVHDGRDLPGCLLRFHVVPGDGQEYVAAERTVESEFHATFGQRRGTRDYFVTLSCEGSTDVYQSPVLDAWAHDNPHRPFSLGTVVMKATNDLAI